jgi:hypothetical protein
MYCCLCTSIILILVVGLLVVLYEVLYEIGGWNVDENGNLHHWAFQMPNLQPLCHS